MTTERDRPTERSSAAASSQFQPVLVVAAWFGLVAGLLEGIGFLALQQLMYLELPWFKLLWPSKQLFLSSVSVPIVWIAPLSNLLLFAAGGVVLAAVSRLFPRLSLIAICVPMFTFLAVLDVMILIMSGPIKPYAVALLALGFTVALLRFIRKREAIVQRFWRKSLPWVGASVLASLVIIEGTMRFNERRANAAAVSWLPNILLIVVDTLRADHLSCYGYPRGTSPNIDGLARQGALFENAVSTSSWTISSHASLFTGLYPHQHGVEWNNPRALMKASYPTLAEALQTVGYRTAAFSANTFWVTQSRFGRGFARFEDFFHSPRDMFMRTVYGVVIDQFILKHLGFEDLPARKRADDVNEAVVRWIRSDQEKSFFAFLNYVDTHDPYLPPHPYRGKFSRSPNPGGILNPRMGRFALRKPEQVQGELDAYDGAIAYVDDRIGRLITELQRLGLDDSTLIIVMSDHGEEFGEHGLYLHGQSLYREVIQVPLIVRWRQKIPPGIRVQQPVSIAAIPTSVLQLIGANHARLFPGRPLSELWESADANTAWPDVLSEMPHKPWDPKGAATRHGALRSLVDRDWHYIRHDVLGEELYDWRHDPLESHSMVKEQAAVGRLRDSLNRLLGQQPPVASTPSGLESAR